MKTYPTYRYDDRLTLKVSPLLKLIMLYSVRHLVFVALAYNPSRKMGAMEFLRHQVDPLLMISDIPAVLLLYAWANRRAGVSAGIEAIWHRGRELLMGSVVLHLGLMLWLSGHAVLRYPAGSGITVIVLGLLDLAILLYLSRSGLVRDIFADYPGGSERK